jgi:hypothetical protein
VLALAGLLSTPLGGAINDYRTRGFANDRLAQCSECLKMMVVCMACSLVLFVAAIYGGSKMAFLAFLFLGEFFLFLPTACMTMATLNAVPNSVRASAIGLTSFTMHAVGDVPSPVVIGYFKDRWAPNCNSVTACCSTAESGCSPVCCNVSYTAATCTPAFSREELPILNPRCSEDADGMRRTLLLAVCWLVWAIILWGIGYCFSNSMRKAQQRAEVRGVLEEVGSREAPLLGNEQ